MDGSPDHLPAPAPAPDSASINLVLPYLIIDSCRILKKKKKKKSKPSAPGTILFIPPRRSLHYQVSHRHSACGEVRSKTHLIPSHLVHIIFAFWPLSSCIPFQTHRPHSLTHLPIILDSIIIIQRARHCRPAYYLLTYLINRYIQTPIPDRQILTISYLLSATSYQGYQGVKKEQSR